MSGRILIIDSVATHRIVLKAKLASAQYDVETCASCSEASSLMEASRADLVLVNLSDPTEDRHSFCRNLRNGPGGDSLAIIGICVADTSRARFAALDAGADDVLPHQVGDALMQARIRSLLRRRNVGLEWQLRDETSRALGFDETRDRYEVPGRVSVLADDAVTGARLAAMLKPAGNLKVAVATTSACISANQDSRKADLFVIDGTLNGRPKTALFELISDIHARQETRRATKLVVLPKGQENRAAMLLDLGADDVVFTGVSQEELILRARVLIAHKGQQDRLRDRVRSGLRAAVTDPLTGLYNRRYAETHLKRIADQAHATGREYAMMVIDIDHFKTINDTHGHSAGDGVLRELANRLRRNFRAIDLIARIGGEEFLIALPDTSVHQAHLAAERMRAMVNGEPFDVGEGVPNLKVTVSVGVAVEGQDGIDPVEVEHLFDRADQALYRSKAAGRNMVSVAVDAA